MHPALFTTPGVRQFAEEIDAERQRQIAKFGEQHHPDGTGLPIHQHAANRYRDAADRNAAAGVLMWRDVLLEEVYEALAESDTSLLRAELVQVAAVCAAWAADIDSRTPAEKQPTEDVKGEQPTPGPAPRTERAHWVDIANALNAAADAGMPVGIDIDGTLTDRNAWSVVWDAAAARWTVAGYDEDIEERPACAKCRRPFDPADTRYAGRARYSGTPYCRGCVEACHDNEIADHRCVICA
ncbi:hypothetical protein [Streptomyces silaceus]|uniref:hypothetical protein n=1 Tax=Streptomyces silaceus TaxID=545123 RepID=UPI0007C63DC8|nr:hypothetical protein [Streptomyces silaceus]